MIQEFLRAKRAFDFVGDTDKFTDYPIQFTDETGDLTNGFIQDADEKVEGDTHILEVIILVDNEVEEDKFYTIIKTCKAPIDCKVDWDLVHCAFDLVEG